MKKILTLSALIVTALMLATPLGVGAVVSDFHYSPSLSYVQLGPLTRNQVAYLSAKGTPLVAFPGTRRKFSKKPTRYPLTLTPTVLARQTGLWAHSERP